MTVDYDGYRFSIDNKNEPDAYVLYLNLNLSVSSLIIKVFMKGFFEI